MSKQLWVRRSNSSDIEDYTRFAVSTPNNLVDPDIFTYPRVLTLTAHTEDKTVAFLPIQTTFTLESLAINPEASQLEVAEALRQLTKTVIYEAQVNGIKEVYFVCKDESTANFASRYYEELPFRTFRLKLNSLEAQKNAEDSHPN